MTSDFIKNVDAREVTLSQAWYFSNRFSKLDPQERRDALLNLALMWAMVMGYEQLQIPQKVSPKNFRKFFLDCIADLSFDNVRLDRVAA